ncbi:MAG: MerR family transcriptional regulator [Gammaproteobacteria bacterium HGW-Gammaproteobacteria-11]|nr:MAG: MerR family transcriptional regulator [Gammaproteobacteria bacterium HGW-Gammaproteobacteria-11]
MPPDNTSDVNVHSFTLDDICTITNLPRRTVRYYIQLGLVDRPQGETRAARYTQTHLEQLLLVKRWAQEGLSLERIRELQEAERQPQLPISTRRPGSIEVWSHLLLDQGIELKVEPQTAGLSPEQLRELLKRCMAALADIRKED